MITNRFISNGYPRSLVHRILTQRGERNMTRKPINTKPIIYLKLPFLNDRISDAINSSIKTAHLPAHICIAFSCGKPLWKYFPSGNAKSPCGSHCICGSGSICHSKNIVYKVSCKICNDTYIGETHRTLRSRMLEHLKRQSNVSRHYADSHNIIITSTQDFDFKIIKGAFKDTTHRTAYESNVIRLTKPGINIQFSIFQ